MIFVVTTLRSFVIHNISGSGLALPKTSVKNCSGSRYTCSVFPGVLKIQETVKSVTIQMQNFRTFILSAAGDEEGASRPLPLPISTVKVSLSRIASPCLNLDDPILYPPGGSLGRNRP